MKVIKAIIDKKNKSAFISAERTFEKYGAFLGSSLTDNGDLEICFDLDKMPKSFLKTAKERGFLKNE